MHENGDNENRALNRRHSALDTYMYFVLEYGGACAHDMRHAFTLRVARLVLFQALYALGVAARECAFAHLDLHLRNVLLLRLSDTSQPCTYRHNGQTWYCEGWLVKITDFGLSRARLATGEEVYNSNRPEVKF